VDLLLRGGRGKGKGEREGKEGVRKKERGTRGKHSRCSDFTI